ncbi:MAG TPA: VOC family protein [Candidatus Baltobacteraceae bacterium]|nr:VOC family protein [Candidatus Baltobacteraceae bacterium]
MTKLNGLLSRRLGTAVAAGALTIGMAAAGIARPRPPKAPDGASDKVVGMAFDGHSVANLDDEIKYWEVLGYTLTNKPEWKLDKEENKLDGTPGAERRTAIMSGPSSVSHVPFNLILTEYRGVKRQDFSDLGSNALGNGHIDLTVMDDCNIVMNKFKDMGLLKVPQMFSAPPRPDGKRSFVFLDDPSGWLVELFAKPLPAAGAPPESPKVSNSSATPQNIDRLGIGAGFNHIGINIIDMPKELSFYQGVLGGDYPAFTPAPPPAPGGRPRMNMENGWFKQAATNGADGHLRVELLGSPRGDQPLPDEHISDINVNYIGFQVTDIDAVYAAAKADGAKTVSEGGIMKVKDGRAVMLQDPDIGAYVELWQPK